MRRGAAAAVSVIAALLLVLMAGTTPTSAAGLTIAATNQVTYVRTLGPCSAGPLVVSPTGTAVAGKYSSVGVSGPLGTCTAGSVIVYESSTAHQVDFSGVGTVSNGALTVSSSPFAPPTTAGGLAFVMLDGWPVAATWSNTLASGGAPITPVDSPITVSNYTWALDSGTQFCATFTVTNTNSVPSTWVIRAALRNAPFDIPAGQAIWDDRYDLSRGVAHLLPMPQGQTAPSVQNAAPPRYQVTGDYLYLQPPGSESYRTLQPGASISAMICDTSAPAPAVVDPGPSTYSVVVQALIASNQACVKTTVTGLGQPDSNGLDPWIGWHADFDWASVLGQLRTAGSITAQQYQSLLSTAPTTWSSVAPSSRYGSFHSTSTGGTTYRLVGTDNWNTQSVRGGLQLSAQGCVSLPAP